jgi:hypothetical protein
MNTALVTGAKTYPWSDSWLLYAIIHASRSEPAELARIIAVGDHYNHAAFTHDELYGGLDRLISGGWVVSKEHLFSASDEALKSYAVIQKKGLSCYDEMKLLEEAINSKFIQT